MKRLKLAFRIALLLAWLGVVLLWWTRPVPLAPPVRPVGPRDYTAFAVDLDGEWIKIRNSGDEVLTDCEIEFTAELDSPGEARYQGKRRYARWEPGQTQEIGISTPRGPTGVLSVQFNGRASSPDKGWGFWRLAFPARAGGG